MMEADGAKGVVAVLQRLNNREVVIALADGQRDQESSGQAKSRAGRQQEAVNPLQPLKSSVHTNTDRARDSTVNRHVQICDDRFASCYQVAHCSVSPTSPAVPVSEFPPQRANPAYNEGNFEVGGQGSWQSEGPCRASHFRGGLTWPDRGSVYCNKSSRDADAFADSLRKYPSESPERSPSSELVERLLRYTQAKYAQKAAKSMRSISTEKSPDRRGVRNQSRHMQTALRSQDTIRRSGSPSRRMDSFNRRGVSPAAKRDCGTNSVEVVQEERGRSRNRRSRSRPRNIDVLDATYDYLKVGAGGSRDLQASERLRMEDISRQVHSVIKQFCKPSPVVFQVCPRIQKRYLAHKKICPVRNSATWMSEEDDSDEASTSSRVGRFFQSIGVACEGPSNTHLKSSQHSQQQIYCHCTQTVQCQCQPTTDNKSNGKSIQPNAQYKCQSSNVRCTDPCECKPLTDKGYYNKRIKEEVARWLTTIPLDNNESPEDKKRREDMGKQLVETLNSLPDDENFEDKARDAIEKCVNEMSMWYPGTKKDEELMKKQLATHLLDKITNIPKKPDKLRDAAKNFINSINFKEDVDRDVITDNFVNRLKFYGISAPKDNAVFKELLINEITEMLVELPIQYRGNKNIILNTLARKLADEVELLLKDKDVTDERVDDSLKHKFKEIISKWFNEVADVNDKLPSSDELNKIINNLSITLDNIQSQGVDEITIHKMEMKINDVLEELDTPVKLIDDLTDSLIDNITDVIYARDKNKLESLYKQLKFKELNDWLQNLKGIEHLNPAEQYKLTREIVEQVPDSNDEKNKAYQDRVLQKISDVKGHVDPLTVVNQMDEIIDRLQLLPEKLKKDDLIANIQNDIDDMINKCNIPESEKRHLKDKTKNIVMGNMQASPLATQRDLDDMREMLLEQIYDTIEHLPIKVQHELKNKLDNVLDKHINKIQSENDKDSVRHKLLKELNYIIDKEPIPDDDKNDIKYNIKNTINDNFDQPFSYHVQDHIKANISGIVDNADIEKEKKGDLISKLTNVVDKKVAKLPQQSMKEYVKNKIFQDMSKAINKSGISEDAKDTIKQKLKYMLNHNFDQPFSADIKDVIFNDINQIIDNSVIPRSLKTDLKQKLIHDADKNLVDLPDQTTIDHTKECIMKEVNELLEDISLPKEQLHDLKKALERTFAEYLDRPYTRDRRDKLNETLNNIISDLDIPSDSKQIITDKLINITDKKLDQLAYQTPEEYARDAIVRDIKQVLSELSLATNEKEKQELEKRFEDLVEKSLHSGYLDEGRDVIKQGLVDIVRDTSAPQHKQDDFIFKSLHAVSKILDESYYEDYDREQLKDFYDMIDSAKMRTAKKNILKPKTKKIVDDHTLDPDYGNVKDVIKQAIDLVDQPSQMSISGQEPDVTVDDEVIEDITNAIRKAPLPNKKKALLENNLDVLVEKLINNEDVDATIKDLEKIIDDIPQSSHDKKVLKSKLAMMVAKDSEGLNKQLKDELIKDLECAVDSISLGKEKESELKSKMKDLVSSLDEPVFGNVKDKLKDGAFNIVNKAVHSKDKKSQLRDRITSIVDRLPSQKQDKSTINDKLIKRIGDIVDETPIRSHIKEDIKSQIRDIIIISENAKNKTKEKMKQDIANIIYEAPITEYQKRALKHKITKVLDPLPETSGEKKLILDNIYKILDDESLSKVKKSELKKKIQDNLSDIDESTANYVKNKKIKDVLKAIDDTVMPKDKKASLKAKLEHELTKNIETLPSSSKPKQKLLRSLEDSISNEIDNALIPQSTKSYLKKRIKGTLPHLLQQPMSTNVEESINKELSKILEEVALSKAEKDILRNNLANTISENIGEPRSNTETTEMRNNIIHDINSVLDEIQMPKDDKKELQFQLQDLLNEFIQKPVTTNTLKAMDKEIKNIIADAPLSKEKKAEIQNKLGKIIEHNLKPSHDYKKYQQTSDKKIGAVGEIDSIFDDIPINSVQKKELTQQIKECMEEAFNEPMNKETMLVLKDNINDIISAAPIPKDKKSGIVKKLSNIIDDKTKLGIDKQNGKLLESELNQSKTSPTRKEIPGALVLGGQPQIQKRKTSVTYKLQNEIDNRLDEPFTRDEFDDRIPAIKSAVTDAIYSILDKLHLNNNERRTLANQLKIMLDENLEKPINSDTMLHIKDGIIEIISEHPTARENETEIGRLVSDMISDVIPSSPAKGIIVDDSKTKGNVMINTEESKSERDRARTKPPQVKNATVHQEIDSVVDQLKIPTELKSVLQQKLKSKAEEGIEDIGTIPDQRLKLNKKKFKPVHKKSVVTEEIDTKADNQDFEESSKLPTLGLKLDKMKYKPDTDTKSAVTEEIDAILDAIPMNYTQKDRLKQQLKDMVDENIEEPINNDTLRAIKNNIDNIISEAPISSDKKSVIRKKLNTMVDNKIGSSYDTKIDSYKHKPTTKQKILTKDIRELQSQGTSTSERKHSMDETMVSKAISDIKADVENEIDAMIDQLGVSNYQKESLKQQIIDVMDENSDKPIDKDTMRYIKNAIKDIVSEAPISKENKRKLTKNLDDIIDNKVECSKDANYKKKTVSHFMSQQPVHLNKHEPVSDIKETITADIDSIIGKLQINAYEKAALKNQLHDMVDEHCERPMNNDTMRHIKNTIHNIVSEAPIPKDKKQKLTRDLAGLVENKIQSMPDQSLNYYREPVKIKSAVTDDIDSIIDQLSISSYQKNNLKRELNNMVNTDLNKPTNKETMTNMKHKINEIISQAPIPKDEKMKTTKKLANLIEHQVEPHSDKDTKDKYTHISNIEPLVADDINDIVEQLDVSNNQKYMLKQQLNDAVSETLENGIDSDRKGYMKSKINDIISKASIPKDKKQKLTKDLNDMIEDKIELMADKSTDYKYTPVSHVKTAVMEDIDSIVDQLDINNYQKNDLKQQLNEMVDLSLEKPMEKDTIRMIKNNINDIVSKAPISKAEKIETRNKLNKMIDDKLESLPEKSKYKTGLDKRPRISEDINDVVDQLALNNYQSDSLKHQLKDIMGDNLDKPINKDTIRLIKNKINDTVSEAPIPKDKKQKLIKDLAYIIDQKVESIPSESTSYKKKPVSYLMSERPVPLSPPRNIYEPISDTKDAITEGIDSIIDQLQINDSQKSNLRHQIQEMVIENLEKPFDNNTVRQIEIKINDIVSEAPISKDKKQKLIKDLGGVVKDNIESGPSRNIDYDYNPFSEIKAAVIDDMDSIIHQLDLNDYQKDNLKRELNNMVDTNLEKPINVDTKRNIQTNINNIISKAPISKDKKIRLTKKLIDVVNDKVESLADQTVEERYKPISEIKSRVTDSLDSTIDGLDLDDKQKENIREKLNDLLEDNAEKPINKDTIRTIKKQLNDIVSEIPIPKNKKAEVINKLNDMLDNKEQFRYSEQIIPDSEKPRKVSPRISDSKQPKLSPNKINNMRQDFDTALEQIQIPNEQKKALKRDLKEKMDKRLNEPLSVNVLNDIKEDIKNIITKAPLSKEKKAEIRNKISNMVDNNFGEGQPKAASRINANKVISEIDSDLDRLQISDYEKNKIRNKLKNMIRENSRQPAQVIKEGIYNIIEEANIPRNNKAEIINKLNNRVDQDSHEITPKTALDSKAKYGRKEDVGITAARERPSGDKRHDTKQGTVLLKDDALHNINNVLETLQIPSEEKINVISKINDKMTEYSGKPMSNDTLSQIKEEINDIITQIPIDKEDQIALEKKIFKELGKNREYLSDEDYPTSSYKKAKREYENPRSSKRSKPARSQWAYPRRRVTYDVEDANTKYATSTRTPRRKYGPNESSKGRPAVKQNLTEAAEDNEDDDDEYEDIDSADEMGTTDMISRNISGILDELAISKQKKKDLRGQVKRTLNLQNSKSDLGMGHNKMLKKTESVISGLPIPDHIKEMMRVKLGITHDSLSPECGFTTSTPKKGRKNWEEPKSFSSISFDDIDSLEMNEYWDNINDSINSWLDSLPIDLDEETKEEVREGIARDIRNRQEYLKSNPNAMKSIPEELENIQNQVFRRLSKVLDADDMRVAMRAANDLMQSMYVVDVPQQTRKIVKARSSVSFTPEMNEFWNSINDSINSWLDSLPVDLDEETKQAIRKGIARDIRNRQEYLKVNLDAMKSIPEELDTIQNEVLRRLSKVLDKDDMRIVKRAADDLMQSMNAVKIPKQIWKTGKTSSAADYSSNPEINEYWDNINDSINNWLDSLPIDLDEETRQEIREGISRDIKNRQEYFKSNPDAMKSIPEELKDIQNQVLRRLSTVLDKDDMRIAKRGTDNLMQSMNAVKIPKQMWKKGIASPTVGSNDSPGINEYWDNINDSINNWLDSLPIDLDEETRQEIREGISRDIKNRQEYFKSNPDAMKSIPEELKDIQNQVLKRLGKVLDKDDMRIAKRRADDLIQSMNAVKIPKQIWKKGKASLAVGSNDSPEINEYWDNINDSINNCLDSLPIDLDEETKQTIREGIARDIRNRQDFLKFNPDAMKSIPEELKDIQNQVLRRLSTVLDKDDMRIAKRGTDNLMQSMNAVKIPKQMWKKGIASPTVGSNDSPGINEYWDNINDSINNWLDSLPIDLDEETRQEIREGISRDIKNRQEYFKSNPDAIKSIPEELKDIQNQVLRRLSTVLYKDDMRIAKRETDNLMQSMNAVKIPKQMWKKGIASPTVGSNDSPRINEYWDNINDSINNWLDSLPIDLDEETKQTIREGIARDIRNRQEYFKSNPDAMKSIPEELKDIQNQVLRRLSKVLDKDDMHIAKRGTDNLMQSMNAVKIPKQMWKKGIASPTVGSNDNPGINEYWDNINDSINNWLDSLPIDLDEETRQEIREGISRDIKNRQEYFKSNPDAIKSIPEELKDIQNQVLRRLSTVLDKDDMRIAKRETDNLMQSMNAVKIPKQMWEKGIASPTVGSNDSPGINEYWDNINDSINNWLDSLPIDLDEETKQTIREGIARDIRNRQEYFKSNPDAMKSIPEELKDIQNQVLKRLGKVLDKDDMRIAKRRADDLIQSMNAVKIPKQIWKKGKASLAVGSNDSPEINEYWDNINDSINNWLDSLPIDLDEETKQTIREGIARDIRNKQEFFKSNPDAMKSIPEELKDIQNQVLRRLSKVLDKDDMRIAKRGTDNLMQSMNAVKIPKQMWKKGIASPTVGSNDSPGINEYWDNINDSINNWLDSLPIDLDEETKQKIREGIARDIRNRQEYLKSNPNAMTSIAEELENVQYNVLRRLSKVLDEDDMKVVKEAANDLIQSMNAVKVPRRMKAMSGEDDVADWKSPEAIQKKVVNWIDTLPLEPSVKNTSKFQSLERDLASNLIDRLEEMNSNPEILNDDHHYEDMLNDEVDKLISELPIDPDEITSEKEDLIKQLIASKPTTLAGKEGTIYRQQLKDTISKTLPIEDGSPEDMANFELLKDGVADAFVSLHYAGGGEEQRKKLKKRMYDEVHKYCNDYLKKHPDEPVSTEKLADGLYNALKKVPLPPEDSMRSEEEQIRVKDVINEWKENLPLNETTPTKRLQINKDASKLASKLRDIERNDSQLPDLQVNTEMQKQITNFLKTLPLKPGQEKKIDTFGKQLISKLRATKFARRVDDSTRCSISQDDTLRPIWSDYENDGMCPFYKSLLERRKQQAKRKSQCIMHPPCSLSDEDREHLERIRQRTCMTPDCLSALLRGGKRNSFVDPMVTEIGSQTEQNIEAVGQRISFQPCPSTDRNSPRPCPGIPLEASGQAILPQVTKGQFAESGSQIEIQPQIIIKEYYWDTTTSDIPRSGSRHSTASLRRRCTVPCEQLPPYADIRSQHPMRSQNKSFQERRAGPSLPCTSSPYIPQPCRSRPSLSHISPCDPGPFASRVCSPRPFTPRPFTSRTCNSPMSQSFIPQQQSTPRNSFGQFNRDCEYNGPKRNGLQQEYPECSGSRYSRKERVIELGSLDDLRKPSQRIRSDNCEWCSHFPEDDFWGTPSTHEVEDDSEAPCCMPYIREKKEERIRCKCKEKLMMNIARRRPRQHCQKHSNIWTNCLDNSRKNCSRCFGSHCPYPSYMYFQE